MINAESADRIAEIKRGYTPYLIRSETDAKVVQVGPIVSALGASLLVVSLLTLPVVSVEVIGSTALLIAGVALLIFFTPFAVQNREIRDQLSNEPFGKWDKNLVIGTKPLREWLRTLPNGGIGDFEEGIFTLFAEAQVCAETLDQLWIGTKQLREWLRILPIQGLDDFERGILTLFEKPGVFETLADLQTHPSFQKLLEEQGVRDILFHKGGIAFAPQGTMCFARGMIPIPPEYCVLYVLTALKEARKDKNFLIHNREIRVALINLAANPSFVYNFAR